MYTPNRSIPNPTDVSFSGWLLDELTRIAASQVSQELNNVTLTKITSEPVKLYDGLVVYADGIEWNPSGGEGVYTYYNSTWNKMG